MQSLLLTENSTKEVVLFFPKTDETSEENEQQILHKLQQTFLPDISILVTRHENEFVDVAPFAAQYTAIDNKSTLYVCEHFSCQAPTTDVDKAIERLIRNRHR